ncbi:unnamed protein product [Rotaria socialis]|uniref:FAM124 domain-containing protein n=1 Tax=Rotaria socialis TaxID=392032 RepID=A0A821I7R0_9BILA|nr:unnamed protein product [Rotaria socialis]CAF3702084.1 unnamed protein product [Rotaria socialis]CAF3705553.1 unnamed protein product [Rotaria socialis]CAF4463740.1 unnamed protein product [Rotaria socialis]CAF4553371.1 unnamed protein product [Rotaria socialis]
MTADHNCPCELILKIGCNEYDEISTAITSLLRSCSITDPKFFFVERQIQPTTYFGSFTANPSNSKIPIQCQSLSCVIFLTDEILKKHEKKDFFKSIHTWNFHHKIELLDEYKQIIARQDYYELSHLLPLWSISHLPYNRHVIIRFNIFTKNFDSMLKFYKHLFQRQPDSSKTGFVVFNLSSPINNKLLYQLSIKYSPSIQSYTISQGAYLKFRLTNLNYFIHEYTSKLFSINKYEYYIYDPDGNLLHLHLHNLSSNIKECISLKPSIHTNDSGFGDSSDPSTQLLNSAVSQIYQTSNDIDGQSYTSNDSAQCSSISSNEINTQKMSVHHNNVISKNNISVRSANKSEINYRLKQQQRTVFPYVSLNHQQWKPSLYESEPRLSNFMTYNNRYYSSMNNIRPSNKTHSFPTKYLKSPILTNSNDNNASYAVDSPVIEPKKLTNSSTYGYLNAFLLKKKQQAVVSQKVKENIKQLEKSNIISIASRPKSVPLIDPLVFSSSKPTNVNLQQTIHDKVPSLSNRSSQPSVKTLDYEWENSNNDVSYTDEEDVNTSLNQTQTPRINIGITLDSRLTKTPVLDMLRSTTMRSERIASQQRLNRTFSLRHGVIPIARF